MENTSHKTPQSTTQATNQTTNQEPPNLFRLRGKKKEILFSTTSISGRPQFNYQNETRSLNFIGDEINMLRTQFGTLATVLLEQVPDSHVTYLTLLVPGIVLPKEGGEFPIETKAIFTTHRTPFVAPGGQDNGLQIDTYETLTLEGTAAFVFF